MNIPRSFVHFLLYPLWVLLLLLPAGAVFGLEPPPITPNDEFFVENNGSGVQVAPPDWHLIVDGAVATPLELSLAEIKAFPQVSRMATLECYGNPFAFKQARLIGNAVWTGVPLSAIIAAAGPLSAAQSIVFTALDGYTASFALGAVQEHGDILLAYGMNGEELPPEQGYPLRLVLPGVLGTIWVQWVTHISFTEAAATSTLTPIPLHAQIFSPQDSQVLLAGPQTIQGMALVGEGAEVVAVEVSTDGGSSWGPAELLSSFEPNAWKHWQSSWEPPGAGTYNLAVRAADDGGSVQGRSGLFGWDIFSISVTVDNDTDSDGVGDSFDICRAEANPDQLDTDGSCPAPPYTSDPQCGDACETTPVITTSSTTTTIRQSGGGGGGSPPPASTTTSAMVSTSSSSTTSMPAPLAECDGDDACDDGTFCNGVEQCIEGACVAGQRPCTEEELCVEDPQECRGVKTLQAQTLQSLMLRPFLLAQRCPWLVLHTADDHHVDQSSAITLEGPSETAMGVVVDSQRSALRFQRFVLVPLCIERSATAGWWNVALESRVEEPDGAFIERLKARLEIK